MSGGARAEGEGQYVTDISQAAATRTGALSTLRLAELQQLASSMGISVNAKMRKADLVSAIREQRGGGSRAAATETATPSSDESNAEPSETPESNAPETIPTFETLAF